MFRVGLGSFLYRETATPFPVSERDPPALNEVGAAGSYVEEEGGTELANQNSAEKKQLTSN